MGLVKFNGVSTDDLGLIVQFVPTYHYPEKEYENYHIPGRNGDLVIDKGSYMNVERTYSIAKVYRQGENFVVSANKIVSWLHSASGYAKLEDSYEPEYYRMAMYKADGEFNDFFATATAIDITFECKPQRWLKSGENLIAINSGDSLKNPTSFDAHPTISFEIASLQTATITIDDITITFDNSKGNSSLEVLIDCENMECYDPNSDTLYNSKLTLNSGKFPVIKANKNVQITYTNNMTNVHIQPRWWTL